MKEIWTDIKGYEGYYQISTFGNVKRLVSFRCKSERILKPRIDKLGYKKISLCVNNETNEMLIHRLVMLNFTEIQEDKPCVNHIDGNPSNNHIENLEWCTHRENIQHAHDTGLASSQHLYKKVIRDDGVIYKSLTQAAVEAGVTVRAIWSAVNYGGNCNKHKYKYM